MTTNDKNPNGEPDDNENNEFPPHMSPEEFANFDSPLPLVELRPTYSYTCENCGRDSMVNTILRETRDTTHLMIPAIFKCGHCKCVLRGIPSDAGGFPE